MNTKTTRKVKPIQKAQKSARLFTIPKAIASNFRIKGDLSSVAEWRAKVLMGNSGTVKVGAWDEVGYVLISTDSANIIPIARSDEHQCGYEVLGEIYFKRKLVQREKYVAIFAFGHNYVWQESARQNLKALRRFREYGGRNSILKGMNEHSRYIATIDDFIGGDGSLAVDPTALSPVGRFVIGKLEAIAKGIVGHRKQVFAIAFDFVKWIEDNAYEVGKVLSFKKGEADKDLENWERETLTAEADEDFERLSRLFFSINGLKNNFHNRLREAVNKKTEFEFQVDDIKSFWSNMELALMEFERLSQI